MASVQEWRAFSRSVLTTGNHILDVIEVPVTEKRAADRLILVTTLLIRTVSHVRATILLVEADCIVEARTMVRNCLENLFFANSLAINPDEFVKRLQEDEISSRKRRAKILISRTDLPLDKKIKQKTARYLKHLEDKWPNTSVLNPKKEAKDLPVEGLYIFHAQLSSDAAHASATSLHRYLVQNDDNGVPGYDTRPLVQETEVVDTLDLLCTAAICVYKVYDELFKNDAVNTCVGQISRELMAMKGSPFPANR